MHNHVTRNETHWLDSSRYDTVQWTISLLNAIRYLEGQLALITSIDITDRALVQMARQIMYIPVIYYYTNDKGQVRHPDEMNIVV